MLRPAPRLRFTPVTHHSSRIKTTSISILLLVFCDTRIYLAHFVIEQPDFDPFSNNLKHNDTMSNRSTCLPGKKFGGGNRMSVTCACMDYSS